MTSAGGLYKSGIMITNCNVLLNPSKLLGAETDRLKGEITQKEKQKQEIVEAEANIVFAEWVGNGRKSNTDGCPILNRKDAYAIIRVHLPWLDVKKQLGQFKNAKDCVKWLGEIGQGTTWDEEMSAWVREYKESNVEGV